MLGLKLAHAVWVYQVVERHPQQIVSLVAQMSLATEQNVLISIVLTGFDKMHWFSLKKLTK